MKAEIIRGTLVLLPGTETEYYALSMWAEVSKVQFSDAARIENHCIRGSRLKICEPIIPTSVNTGSGGE